MKVCIIGSGAVALMTAAEICNNSQGHDITIFDTKNGYETSASHVAGAMEAVIGEVEHGYSNDAFSLLLIELGIKVREKWTRYYATILKDCLVANETIVFLNKNANEFEAKNFSAMVQAGREFDEIQNVRAEEYFFNSEVKTKELVIRLKNERAFDPRLVLFKLRKFLLESKVRFENYRIDSIDHMATEVYFNSNRNKQKFDKIIVCAGANSMDLFANELGLIPLMRGVGTALLCTDPTYVHSIKPKTVYRSVNRGGSQCGLHLVPLSNTNYYLGAGNTLSWDMSNHLRFETVRYLMNELEADILGKNGMYKSQGNILRGDRTRTFDYKPVLGTLKENRNIVIATGFNRVGLTMSPVIAHDIINIINDRETEYFSGYCPQRQPQPYGTINSSAEEFSEIVLANLIEHSLVNESELLTKKKELYEDGLRLNKIINDNLKLDGNFGHSPDALSVLALKR